MATCSGWLTSPRGRYFSQSICGGLGINLLKWMQARQSIWHQTCCKVYSKRCTTSVILTKKMLFFLSLKPKHKVAFFCLFSLMRNVCLQMKHKETKILESRMQARQSTWHLRCCEGRTTRRRIFGGRVSLHISSSQADCPSLARMGKRSATASCPNKCAAPGYAPLQDSAAFLVCALLILVLVVKSHAHPCCNLYGSRHA